MNNNSINAHVKKQWLLYEHPTSNIALWVPNPTMFRLWTNNADWLMLWTNHMLSMKPELVLNVPMNIRGERGGGLRPGLPRNNKQVGPFISKRAMRLIVWMPLQDPASHHKYNTNIIWYWKPRAQVARPHWLGPCLRAVWLWGRPMTCKIVV